MPGIDAALKSARPRPLAALRRFTGDLANAEDAFQDAAERALRHWKTNGLPDNPTAWLITTGRRLLIDQQRRNRFSRPLDQPPASDFTLTDTSSLDDDLLRLIFCCCHPALPETAQVALTLKVIAGLPTEAIAAAFLTATRTMEQRLTRARSKIRDSALPYAIPEDHELGERLAAVLATIYLIFNQGYSGRDASGPERRLCQEAIWLGRLMLQLFPGNPETAGLLAMMLLHHARHAARQSSTEQVITLNQQDRSIWDKKLIREGRALLQHALDKRVPGPYQTQAAITALHCEAETQSDTDWSQIEALYAVLERQTNNPVVTVNRAVALGMSGQPKAGLELIGALEPQQSLHRYAPYWLAQAELHELLNENQLAQKCLDLAMTLVKNESELEFLRSKSRLLSSNMGN
ncbi:MAG: RNA polymerase sigma factor [Woeseiaceae bacterium]